MNIGERVYITEEVGIFGKIYQAGHQFTITGSSYRGLDLEDDNGNKIAETLLINNIIRPISELRDKKIDIITKDDN